MKKFKTISFTSEMDGVNVHINQEGKVSLSYPDEIEQRFEPLPTSNRLEEEFNTSNVLMFQDTKDTNTVRSFDCSRHGSLAKVVRSTNFRIGDEAYFLANSPSSIRVAFYSKGFNTKIERVSKASSRAPFKYYVKIEGNISDDSYYARVAKKKAI
jgi:hypothetical protein